MNADGYVIIETKIDTEDLEKFSDKLKDTFNDGVDVAEKSASDIEDAFDDIDVSDTADGLSEGFEEETQSAEKSVDDMTDSITESHETLYEAIEEMRSDDLVDQEEKTEKSAELHEDLEEKLSDMYEDLGDKQADEAEEAWEEVKDESQKGARKVIDNLKKIGDKAKDTGDEIKSNLADKLKATFDKLSDTMQGGLLGGIIGSLSGEILEVAGEAGEALLDFGKDAIELGSELQEVQNVVDVTFTTMSSKVDQFAKDAAKTAGLSETNAKKYVGTLGAMAKSFGFTENEAYEMSTTLVQLTGDVSSFYNLDHDEAYTKMKSVFTGESEALKELGIVMTESTLNQYAMEKGIKKTTAEMTEQEKVSLRFRFVLEQLSDAAGDFARTEEAWANQTRILTNQWESFKASIGQGLIEVLTHALYFINESVMPNLNEFGETFANALSGDPVTWLNFALKHLGLEMNQVISIAPELAASQQEVTKETESTAATVKALRTEYEIVREAAVQSVAKQLGLFDELAEKSDKSAKDIVENWHKQQKALERYTENMQKAIDMGLDEALVKQLSDGSQQSMLILDEFVNGTQISVHEINTAFRGVQASRDVVSATMADVQTGMSRRLGEIASDVESDWGKMANTVGAEIYNMQNYINKLKGKTVYVDVVTRNKSATRSTSSGYSGYSGYSSYSAAAASVFAAENPVPMLAKGTVIPPNAPFLAVLGDQRRGTNIEAPLSTIQEALRTVMAEQSQNERPIEINFTGDLAELVRILYPEIKNANRRESRILGRTPAL